MMKASLLVVMTLVAVGYTEENRQFWMQEGKKALQNAIKLRPNVGLAKNVIMFLGDGMGISTITAARILKGQMEGQTGEEYRLQMEKLPYTGIAKTYNTNQQTPDSAGTGTAYWSGVKTKAGVLGVDQTIVQGNCSNLEVAALETILDWTLREGKSVGLVSTARVTHASPGAGYANIPHRDWESDAEMTDVEGCEGVKDIARQLVEDNHGVQVVLGGGRRNFLNETEGGKRLDGKNLIQVWKDKQKAKGVKYHYVSNNEEMKKVPDDTEFLLGLFTSSHMSYDADRNDTGPNSEPSVADMFAMAHKVLSKNEKGYFLFVEGGRIDHGHHENKAVQALRDTIAFDAAVAKAVEITDEKDTLILTTADHSHVFTMAGYPKRGHDIIGKMMYDGDVRASKAPTDKMPMTILMYANGPGPQRTNLTNVDTTVKDFRFPNGVPTKSETHGGEDVAVFARGPMAHLVNGVHEQNVLAHIMAYASCVGPDKSLCFDGSAAQFCPGKSGIDSGDPNAAPNHLACSGLVNVLASFVLVLSLFWRGCDL